MKRRKRNTHKAKYRRRARQRRANGHYQMKPKKSKQPILTSRLKQWIDAIFMLLLAAVIALSFFDLAGRGGEAVFKGINFLIGKTIFLMPLLLAMGSFLLLKPSKRRVLAPILIALVVFLIGICGILAIRAGLEKTSGGIVGYLASWPFLNYFSPTVGLIVFSALIAVGGLIFWEFLPKSSEDKSAAENAKREKQLIKEPVFTAKGEEQKPASPKFEIKPVEISRKKKLESAGLKEKPAERAKPGTLPVELADDYKRPPLTLFDVSLEKPSSGDLEYNAEVIKKTLLNFGIEVEMAEVNVGPTVTQYTFKPAEGVKLSKITNLNNDLALALAAHPIRIEAPIPGRSLVGVEVPNRTRANVKLGSLIASDEFQKSSCHLPIALGSDVMGNLIFPNLDRMPHLLVAGATGSGKTICLNSLILSLIYKNSPRFLRLILIDPKRVEFPVYTNLPHLLTPVILNAKKAVNALNWLVGEMERRFEVLREFGARDIQAFNSGVLKKNKRGAELEPMPYIVLVIDELADLMLSRGKEVEAGIVRLSQLARAVGIHLVVATQRPSVEVITGLIKANITSRVAFQVASQIDSRTILDTAGADKLLGRGDMLFISAELSRPKRIQGSFVSALEMRKVVSYIIKENAAVKREEIEQEELPIDRGAAVLAPPAEDIVNYTSQDELYDEAREVVLEYQKASASLLQRRLQIGYARAARLLDELEDNGIIGPAEGSKPRQILVSTGPALERENRPPQREQSEPDDEGYLDAGKVEFNRQ